MTFKIKPCLALIALLTAAGMHADVLAWQPNSGSVVERTATVRESVTGLRSVTVKPVRVTSAVLDQAAAASGGSTYPGLGAIPSFPLTDLSPGDRWTADAAVTIDLSPFGHTAPVQLTVPVSYTLIDVTEISGRTLHHVEAEWYPLFVPSRVIGKRTGIVRLSGASRMDLFWDNTAGRPVKSAVTEEIQYRFAENTALLLTRETAEELQEQKK